MKVLGGSLQIAMAEQHLNRPQVRSGLEQMGGPAMAQGVGSYMLGNARMSSGFFTGVPHGFVRDGPFFLAALIHATGEEICTRLLPTPILTQRCQQSRTEWQISTGAALAAFHSDHHALAVD